MRFRLAAVPALLILAPAVASAEPIFGVCISCETFTAMNSTLTQYSASIYNNTAPSAKNFLNAAAYLWVAWVVLLYQLDKAPPFADTIQQFLFLIMAGVALNGFGFWADYVLDPLLGTAIDWATSIAVFTGADTGGQTGFAALIYAAETPPYAIIKPTMSFWDNIGENIARLVISCVLIFIWVGVWFRIEGTLFIGYVRFMIVTAIAPFLVVCAVFPSSRKLFFNAIKEMLHGGLDLVFMAVFIGLINRVMAQLSAYFPGSVEKGADVLSAKGWLFSGDFWNLVFTGFSFLTIHRYVAQLPALLLLMLGMQNPSMTQQGVQKITEVIKGK